MNKVVKWTLLGSLSVLGLAIAKELIMEELLKAEADRRYVALGLGQ